MIPNLIQVWEASISTTILVGILKIHKNLRYKITYMFSSILETLKSSELKLRVVRKSNNQNGEKIFAYFQD